MWYDELPWSSDELCRCADAKCIPWLNGPIPECGKCTNILGKRKRERFADRLNYG